MKKPAPENVLQGGLLHVKVVCSGAEHTRLRADSDQLGIASSTNALFRYTGLSSGTTLSVLIFSFSSNINIGALSGGFDRSAFLHGIAAVYLFDVVCALTAMVFSMPKVKKTIEV